MDINYDVIFPNAPCSILDMDTIDTLGFLKEPLDNKHKKIRLEAGTLREMELQEKVI